MTRPAPTATTERVYGALPELYRNGDDVQPLGPSGYPLLRFLSLLADQLDDVVTLIGRADYYSPDDDGVAGDTSDLVDPATADAGWLAWLAQLPGTTLAATLSTDQQRAAIAGAVAGHLKGTKSGIAAAARSALTGTRFVRVVPNYLGDQFAVEVRTRTSETPSTAAVVAAIVAAGAKPAGIQIVCTSYEATWAAWETAYPHWVDIEAVGGF